MSMLSTLCVTGKLERKNTVEVEFGKILQDNGVFPKQSRTLIKFSEFRESDNPLKHELESI